MRREQKRKLLIQMLGWGLTLGLVSLAALVYYCDFVLLPELKILMSQAPQSQPTTIFSDVFLLKKGDIYAYSFLTERLKDLHIEFRETPDHIEWKGRHFDYPGTSMDPDPMTRADTNQAVAVSLKDDRIEGITIDGKPADAVTIEPTPVATLSGSNKTIRNYVDWEHMPAMVSMTIKAVEDQRFNEHHGFDLRSLARALWIDLKTHSLSQGGSTITQQLVKNLLGTRQKTLFRKLRELILAYLMDRTTEKEVILTKYLNEVYFGQIGALEVHGVSEAAHYFFNKELDKLTLAETALIAGVIRGPAVYSPYKHPKNALARKDVVLKKMAEQDVITKDDLKEALAQKIVFAPLSLTNNRAPYFVDYVKAKVDAVLSEHSEEPAPELSEAGDLSSAGLRIFTTLDLPLQRRADLAVASTVHDLETRFKIVRPLRLEGVLVAAEPKTGFVRALVGGRSYGETTFNRVLNMKRQVGSTFKPIAYLAALLKGTDEKGVPYTGAYMVDDEPWTYRFPNGKKSWSPRNYERGYRGHITLREAFANSINIPMARIGIDVGIDRVIDVAHKLGITEALPNVPSLVLGSVDLNPMELLRVYTTLANHGERLDMTAVRAVVDAKGITIIKDVANPSQEFDAKYVDLLADLLSSVVKEGTAKFMPALGYSKPARGKTGTTSFSRDAWFAGFSQGLVAVTWTGFDELKTPDSEDDVAARKFKSPALLTGAGAALPTWARFFAAAKPGKLVDPDPTPDPSLERLKIDRTSGLRAKSACPAELVYDEVFLPNTAPNDDCNRH